MSLRASACFVAMFVLATTQGCAPEDEGDDGAVATAGAIRGGKSSYDQTAVGKLVVDRGGKESFCTASLISSRAILTAAHCFGTIERSWLPVAPSSARALVRVKATFTIERSASDTTPIEVDAFLAFGDTPGPDDLAIGHLAGPVAMSMAKPLEISDERPSEGELVTLFGYGCGSADGMTRDSQTGTKQRLDTWYGKSEQVICRGDSGGPAIFHGPLGQIVGVMSAVMEKPRILWFGGGRADDAYGDAVKHRDLIRFYARSFATMSSNELPSSPVAR